MTTFALAGCVVSTTGTSGSGGSSSTTGAGGTSGVGGGTGTGGTGGETSGVGGGTGGGCPAYSCAEAITPPDGDPTKLCDGSDAAKAYDALAACTCTGNCAPDCSDNVCMGLDISADCTKCLQDASGCSTEFTDCANN